MADADDQSPTEGDPEGLASLDVAGPEHDLPPSATPIRPYVVCCAPRSGSTLLIQLLQGSGVMGVPAEYLNHRFLVRALGERFAALDADGRIRPNFYLQTLVRRRTSANRVFGIKVLHSQMERWITIEIMRRMLRRSRLIWLRRSDVVGQAISLAIAQETQRWHAVGSGSAAEEPSVPDFSAERVRRVLGTILSEEAAWEQFFAVNRVEPLVVRYEDLVADPDRTCRAICRFVGVEAPRPFSLDTVATRPTGGAVNEEWRARWLEAMRFRDPPAG
jgi:LPS sulfotransferase NodH